MKSKHEINFNPNWNNNELQFARLLCELVMAGAPNDQQMQDLQDSMDLCESDINEVLDRAQTTWTKFKSQFTNTIY